MKYEAPYFEVVRFEVNNNILTASINAGGGAENDDFSNVEETEPDFDPFA